MKSDCNSCKKWKEETYWTRIKLLEFFQILSKGFDQQLVLPQKAVKHLKIKLDSYVSLIGPSGSTWKVGLTVIGKTLVLKQGWKEFADAHSLEVNDLLVFNYTNKLCFDVSVFDSQNMCRKEVSSYIQKCEHTDDDHVASGSGTKRPVQVTHDMPRVGARKKSKASTPTSSETSSDDDNYDETSERGTRKPERGATSSAGVPHLRSRRNTSTSTGGGTSEKRKALELAKAAATPNSFQKVIKRSHISGAYKMTVPVNWVTRHLPGKDLNVTLRCGEKNWKAKFIVEDRGCVLDDAWKKFATENRLNKSDVCLFNLVTTGEIEDQIMLDVTIFRQE